MVVLRAFFGMTKAMATVATVVLIAAGPPLLWVWIGSQVQGGPTPSGTAIVTVIAGLVISYMLIGLVTAAIVARSAGRGRRPIRYAWNRSLRDERYERPRTHLLEDAFVAAALLVTLVVAVWFFFAGDPGVPVTP
jgi:hypothetical protein